MTTALLTIITNITVSKFAWNSSMRCLQLHCRSCRLRQPCECAWDGSRSPEPRNDAADQARQSGCNQPSSNPRQTALCNIGSTTQVTAVTSFAATSCSTISFCIHLFVDKKCNVHLYWLFLLMHVCDSFTAHAILELFWCHHKTGQRNVHITNFTFSCIYY